ncbi:MAG: 2-C-methyl-D-erythritol 2,4-cyclodiphosphate synthase [Symbiobacteriaceae bacterium]|nr:2-C-methyl-D-erythritol 2,4-cyclodiphosphate synthase [Symbiobacteriaceae bacterium]
MRIGIGYDAHTLVRERPLILCGVHIAYPLGLAGHSDADVATHALIDALLGAAALGDIGQHFPDQDPQYQGISSLILLERCRQLLQEASWRVANVDLTIIAEKPRLAPHSPAMRQNLATALACSLQQVSVKATTTEGLGFIGEGRGIAAQAVALIVTSSTRN